LVARASALAIGKAFTMQWRGFFLDSATACKWKPVLAPADPRFILVMEAV
jgi:hypothetical protein